jgi:hypothetical protein
LRATRVGNSRTSIPRPRSCAEMALETQTAFNAQA